jgi:hypothetical protein
VNESADREALKELDRQIELTEQFLIERKQQGKYDGDLVSKLAAYRQERERLLQNIPSGEMLDDGLVQ